MDPNENPYAPPSSLPEPDRYGSDAPTRRGDWHAAALMLIGVTIALVPSVLCCWPAALVVGSLGLFAGINAYNRSEGQAPRLIALVLIVLSALGLAVCVLTLVSAPFRHI